jgi:CspA family cold shock protein
MQGTIQVIHAERGFGFLRDTEGGEVFFHHSALPYPEPFAPLKVGMMVEFEAEPSSKGPRATKGRLVPQTNRSSKPS